MKIKASGPITSWQIDGETVADFILGGSKVTADGDCMRNAGLEEAQAGIKIAGRNINKLRYADDTTLRAESERN